MSRPLQLRPVTSAGDWRELPASRAEVAVVGRSNVGKSSLLNAVAGRRDLAATSKSPGRTRRLVCYAVDDLGTVVDCPGYGYAKASKVDRARWQAMVEGYLVERQPLAMTLVLVDGEVGPTPLDVAMLEGLRERDIPFTIVATKHDKVRAARRERRKRDLAEGCGVGRGEVLWVSATSGVNVDELRRRIVGWLREA